MTKDDETETEIESQVASSGADDTGAPTQREFDVVVWGASGFTGQLVAEYLLGHYGVDGGLRWALGGRNSSKLEELRESLGREAGIDTGTLQIITADAEDVDSMRALAARSRVICSTVGPYALYGSNLVAACADAGTHYCDLTGEVHWMREMIDAHEARARETGARIVFSCGFDCIPSDVGTWFIQDAMIERYGVPASRVKLRVEGAHGGASGGTIASMLNMLDAAESDPNVMKVSNDPYSLIPRGAPRGSDGPEPMLPAYDDDFGEWTAPFVMSTINTKVVRRTNALLDDRYGRDFRYDEAVLTGAGPIGFAKAAGAAAGTGVVMGAMTIGPVRRFATPRLPAPGTGPSRETREAGYFDLRLLATNPGSPGQSLRARVTGDRDPGYGSTSKMLAESAVCLALDELSVAGGCWTPASAMGAELVVRLQKNAGLTFKLEG